MADAKKKDSVTLLSPADGLLHYSTMRLNGWQRLWVVTSVLSLVVIGGASYVRWPTPSRPESINTGNLIFVPDVDAQSYYPLIAEPLTQARRQIQYELTAPNGMTYFLIDGEGDVRQRPGCDDGRCAYRAAAGTPSGEELRAFLVKVGAPVPSRESPALVGISVPDVGSVYLSGKNEDEIKTLARQRYREWLRRRQAVIVGQGIAAWLLLISALYLFGSSIAWVRRGSFR